MTTTKVRYAFLLTSKPQILLTNHDARAISIFIYHQSPTVRPQFLKWSILVRSCSEPGPETTLVVSCVAGKPAHFSEGLRFTKCNSTTKTPWVATEEKFDLG